MRLTWATSSTLLLLGTGALGYQPDAKIQLEVRRKVDSSLANIHLDYFHGIDVAHLFTYGPCEASNPTDKSQQVVARHEPGTRAERLVWVVPEDAKSGGCFAAWTEETNVLLGRSEPVTIEQKPRKQKRTDESIPMDEANGIDVEGAWFDGVAKLEAKGSHSVDATAVKKKKIAIVGAGMSGLMTYLNLKQSGFGKIELIEASGDIGGRVRTDHVEDGASGYQYQEMGAMRIPRTVTYTETGETFPYNDQKLVFQLADALNKLNKKKPELKIDFIPFLQDSPNGLYYYNGIRKDDGTVPTITEAFSNDSLRIPPVSHPKLSEATRRVEEVITKPEVLKMMATNMRKAHKKFIHNGVNGLGGDDWSEFGFLHNVLHFSLNITDLAMDSLSGHPAENFFNDMLENMLFYNDEFSTEWVTVDGGLSRLTEAFRPFINRDLVTNREIEKIDYLPKGNGKVKLSWKKKFTDSKHQAETYDYAVVSAPFSVVRRWRLPKFSPTLSRAIGSLPYSGACKVALQYSSRFWEELEKPIYGSQSTLSDIPGVGSVVYPSYDINGTESGVILGSYVYGDASLPWASMPEKEHVQHVQNAMVEIHGEIAREKYTGKYTRKCWEHDKYQAGAWAKPTIGQQELFLPTYFNTENNVIFVGEHTSYVHAWVSSALESGVRGSVQLLLELGLIDEAKEVTERWMSRWINI